MANIERDGTSAVVLDVQGMKCGACEKHVAEALGRVPGVLEVALSRAAGTANVAWAGGVPDVDALIDAVRAAGYDARVVRLAGAAAPAPPTPVAASRCGCCEVPA